MLILSISIGIPCCKCKEKLKFLPFIWCFLSEKVVIVGCWNYAWETTLSIWSRIYSSSSYCCLIFFCLFAHCFQTFFFANSTSYYLLSIKQDLMFLIEVPFDTSIKSNCIWLFIWFSSSSKLKTFRRFPFYE